MCRRSLARNSIQFAFSPRTILGGNSAAAAATTIAQTPHIRRTVRETSIFTDFIVLQFAGIAGSANWSLSTRYRCEDAHGRMHSRRARIHGDIRRPVDSDGLGGLP